jgi:hypothetical protein
LSSNDTLDVASEVIIELEEITADNTPFNIHGDKIALEGIDQRDTMSKVTSFRRKIKETIEKEI